MSVNPILQWAIPNIVPYQINNHPIPVSRMYSDLGIHINDSLIFDASQQVFITHSRTLHLHNAPMQIKKQLYLSIIRSRLTYCSQLWHPHQFKYINMLKNVQRRCTKFITNDYTSDYKSLLQRINLLPLMYWYDLLYLLFFVKCLKISPGNFNISDYVQFISSSTRNSSKQKLQFKYTRTSTTHHFYFNRIVRLWNAIPSTNTELSFDSIKSYMIQQSMLNSPTRSIHPTHAHSILYVLAPTVSYSPSISVVYPSYQPHYLTCSPPYNCCN